MVGCKLVVYERTYIIYVQPGEITTPNEMYLKGLIKNEQAEKQKK